MADNASTGPALVRQEHPDGCGVAAVAMVTGETYAEVVADLARMGLDLSIGGLAKPHIERLLAARGYVWRTVYRAGTLIWPPAPFAPVHIAAVRQQPSGRAHFVVMLDDARVLDPLERGTTLDHWPEVMNVIGIWPEPDALDVTGLQCACGPYEHPVPQSAFRLDHPFMGLTHIHVEGSGEDLDLGTILLLEGGTQVWVDAETDVVWIWACSRARGREPHPTAHQATRRPCTCER